MGRALVNLGFIGLQIDDVVIDKSLAHHGFVIHVVQLAWPARIELQLSCCVALNDQGAAGLEAFVHLLLHQPH